MLWIEIMRDAALPQCKAERIRHRADTVFLLMMGGRVLAMQTGFAMLEAAYARPMNAANIMMKNMMDLFLGSIVFYFFGYWLAFGVQPLIFEETGFDFSLWFLHLSYATTSATIDSGALAGRVSFIAYLVLSVLLTGFIYPIVVYWAWGAGWLQELGYIDFAGSSLVHMVGAISALVSVCICGPRIGKYPDYRAWKGIWRVIFVERNNSEYYQLPELEIEKAVFTKIKPCNNPVQLLFGTFLLLVGFLGFNPASTLATTLNTDLLSARTTVTTLMAASGGAMASILWALIVRRHLIIKVPDLTNAVLGGLVSSCACCHVIPPVIMLFVGFVGALLTLSTCVLMERRQLDDTVGAVAAHGCPAAWGTLCVAIFAQPHCQSDLRGLVFGGGQAAWEQLGIQCIGLVAIAAFAAVSTYICVLGIDLIGGFRCNRACELIGLDFTEHDIDDGALRLEEKSMTLMTHSPVRDCLVERVKRNITMPTEDKINGEAVDVQTSGGDTPIPPEEYKTVSPDIDETEEKVAAAPPPALQAARTGMKASHSHTSQSQVDLEEEVKELRKAVQKMSHTITMLVHGRSADSENGQAVVGSNAGSRQGGRRAALDQLLQEAELM